MPTSVLVGLVLIFLGLAIVVFNPLVPLGASLGPGWGDILNGSAGLVLLVVGVFVAWVGGRKARANRASS
jgi:hypothetical protein